MTTSVTVDMDRCHSRLTGSPNNVLPIYLSLTTSPQQLFSQISSTTHSRSTPTQIITFSSLPRALGCRPGSLCDVQAERRLPIWCFRLGFAECLPRLVVCGGLRRSAQAPTVPMQSSLHGFGMVPAGPVVDSSEVVGSGY